MKKKHSANSTFQNNPVATSVPVLYSGLIGYCFPGVCQTKTQRDTLFLHLFALQSIVKAASLPEIAIL